VAQTPRLDISVTTKFPKDLEQLSDVVSGLIDLAEAQCVLANDVKIYATQVGAFTRIDAYWTTPAVV
jgi:hypothetical protein